MLAKFTSRRLFYVALAFLSGAAHPLSVRESMNPTKDAKLAIVAARHGIDVARFIRVGGWMRLVWPLFP